MKTIKQTRRKDYISTALLMLSIYLQEVIWIITVPQFPFTNMTIMDITSYIILKA